MTTTKRMTYIDSLRELALILDANPLIPTPHSIGDLGLTFYVQRDLADALAIAGAMATEPVVTRTDSSAFPVSIDGGMAGFAVVIKVAASLALAPGVVLPDWPPLVTELAVLKDTGKAMPVPSAS